MLYSIEDKEDFAKLNELVSLQNQVQDVRLQDKLGEQNYHYDRKNIWTKDWCNRKYLPRYNKNYYRNFY